MKTTHIYISRIEVQNWKSFAVAKFEFPAPTKEANITLIGAPNGYGKTSLFEAIILGLFGLKGLPLITRSPFIESDGVRVSLSYKKFLEKALHQGTTKRVQNSCSVKITFVEGNEPLEIQRTWHFNDNGIFRPKDEEVHIYQGRNRKAAGPKSSDYSRLEWFHDYIVSKLIPLNLANWYIFDGENVSVFAERSMSKQVQLGIESLLGIPVLKNLAQNLRDYASKKQNKSGGDLLNTRINQRKQKLESLNSSLDENKENLTKLNSNLERLTDKRNRILTDLINVGGVTQATLGDLMEQIKNYELELETSESKLEDWMLHDMALTLCGKDLRKKLQRRLEMEETRSRWEDSKREGDNNLEQFLHITEQELSSINPPLTRTQSYSILKVACDAWGKIWNPTPKDCAKDYRHSFLQHTDRQAAIDFLKNLDSIEDGIIVEQLSKISSISAILQSKRSEVTRIESVDPYIENEKKILDELNNQISHQAHQKGKLQRTNESLSAEIKNNQASLNREISEWDRIRPSQRRVSRARIVVSMIDKIVADAVPSQIKAIAEAMTEAYRAMAHKEDLVKQVNIDNSLNVQLLNKNNVDVRSYDVSAGEKQIFTQSLISAVSSIAGREFPMIIDTPLGRLDLAHRKKVLRHLSTRHQQVILLSTNTEVVDEYLEEIEAHVQKKYQLHFDQIGEFGQTTAKVGYFDETRNAV